MLKTETRMLGATSPKRAVVGGRGLREHSLPLGALFIAQGCCGVLLTAVAGGWFEATAAALGVLLGCLTTAVAALGFAGTTMKAPNLLVAQFVVGILVLSSLFNLVASVQRTSRVDCAMAELVLIDDRTKAALEKVQHSKEGAFGAVQLRLEALDHTLELLETRTDLVAPVRQIDREAMGQELQRAHQRSLWAVSDSRFISSKLAAAKEHAMKLVEQLFKQGFGVGKGFGKIKALQTAAEAHMSPADAAELERRFDGLFADTERLVNRIRQHEEREGEVSGDEYVALLAALEHSMQSMGEFILRMEVAVGREGLPMTHADFVKLMHGLELEGEEAAPVGIRPLQQLRAEEEMMAAALRRYRGGEGAYESVRSWDLDVLKKSWRLHWEGQFAAGLPAEGSDALRDLPKHCVAGARGRRMLTVLSVVATLLQALCWHATMGVAMRVKGGL